MIFSINHINPSSPKPSETLIESSKHSSLILNAKTDGRYHWSGEGSLSFKYAILGESRYKLKDRYLLTESNNYIMLNQHQPYEIFVESKLITETFCVFFGQPLAADVLASLKSNQTQLLDDFSPTADGPLFFERTHPISTGILNNLTYIRSLLKSKANAEIINEGLYKFFHLLVAEEYGPSNEIDNLKSIKKSTRLELFKRLTIAKDYAQSMHGEKVTLENLAQVSCLSANHLLRSFRQLYGCSPIQYLTRVRLEKACKLLKLSKLSVQEICTEVGFDSVGSFANLFKKATGSSPISFRNQKR